MQIFFSGDQHVAPMFDQFPQEELSTLNLQDERNNFFTVTSDRDPAPDDDITETYKAAIEKITDTDKIYLYVWCPFWKVVGYSAKFKFKVSGEKPGAAVDLGLIKKSHDMFNAIVDFKNTEKTLIMLTLIEINSGDANLSRHASVHLEGSDVNEVRLNFLKSFSYFFNN